jgi:hypothetical protein
VAVCRDNSGAQDVVRGFIDGVQVGADDASIDGISIVNDAALLRVGAFSDGGNFDYLNGWVDNVRVTNGTCRYTGDFTPPTAAYPTSGT